MGVELLIPYLPAAATILTFLVAWAKLYHRFLKMEESIRILNHNSTAIMRALLYKGVIEPGDLKDGES